MTKKRFAAPCRLISEYLSITAEILSSLGLIVVAVVLLLQVILRYVLSSGLVFAEEISKYTLIWVVLLTGGILAKNHDFIKTDFLDSFYSRRFIKYKDMVGRIILSCMLLTLIKEGWDQAINSWTSNSKLTTLPFTFFWAYISIPVCALIMLLQLIISSFFPVSNHVSAKDGTQQGRD
jgi:TRAP-type transport system small permease protein